MISANGRWLQRLPDRRLCACAAGVRKRSKAENAPLRRPRNRYLPSGLPRRGTTYQPRASAAASAAKRRPGCRFSSSRSPVRATQVRYARGCFALSGLAIVCYRRPRAALRLPWADMVRPFGAAKRCARVCNSSALPAPFTDSRQTSPLSAASSARSAKCCRCGNTPTRRACRCGRGQ